MSSSDIELRSDNSDVSGTTPEIRAELAAELHRRMDHDLRKRSISSALIYLLFMPIVALSTPYLRMHGTVLLAFAVPVILLNTARLLAMVFHDPLYARGYRFHTRLFVPLTIAIAAIWGLFGGVTITLYGMSWTSLLVIIITTGSSAAATASLAPSIMLVRCYLASIIVPSMIAAFAYGGPHGYSVGSLYAAFLAYVFTQARRQYAEYRCALEANVMLRLKTRELNGAKEHAEAASRAKSQFLTTISHEIRTPMNGIVGMTDLALTTELTAEQREYLTLVQESADSLLTIINDMLDFADIEAGRLSLEQTGFDLRQQLDDALGSISLSAYEKGLEVVAYVAPAVPRHLVGDSGRLRQIIANLIGNAVKFTNEGDIILRVDVEEAAEDSVVLHFLVQDTGVGIPPEKRTMIFEAFTQADSSSTRKHGGAGLGLAISAQLVSRMKGRIWLEDNPSGGTSFHFSVRFGIESRAAEPAIATRPAALQGARVLLADDNPNLLNVLGEMLTDWGVMVTTAQDSATAIVRLHRAWDAGRPFGAVLIDADVPPSNALAMLDLMQEQYLPPHGVVIMLPPGARAAEAALYQRRGISAILRKPIRQGELIDALRTMLGLDRAVDPNAIRRKEAA